MRPARTARLLASAVTAVAIVASLGAGSSGEAAAPAGARLLYASSWTGRMRVFAVDAASRRVVGQLTFGAEPGCAGDLLPAGHVDPVPSPDGRKLLYRCSNAWRPPSLWVARMDGASRRRLVGPQPAPGSSPGGVLGAAWTPDSRRIAYAARDGLHVVRADGRGDRLVARGVFGDLSWSPDGRTLASVVGEGVALVRAGRPVPLKGAAGSRVAWSPNGRWIATWYEGGAGGHARPVRLVDPAGRMGPRVGAGRLAAWAPDGRRLAYEAPDGLRVLDLRARRTMLLTRETAYTAADYDERPLGLSWSRDGRSIAYVAGTIDANDGVQSGDLRLVTLGGRARTIVERPKPLRRTAAVACLDGRSHRPAPAPPQPVPATRATTRDVLADGPITRLAADRGRVAFVACLGAFVWTPASRTLVQVARRAWPGTRRRTRAIGLTARRSTRSRSPVIASRSPSGAAAPARWPSTWESSGRGPERPSWPAATSRAPRPCVRRSATSRARRASSPTGRPSRMRRAARWGPPSPSSRRCAASAWPAVRARPSHPAPAATRSATWTAAASVAYGDNETHVLDAEGRQLLSVPVSPLGAQLSGSDLVLLLPSRLRVYDASSGALRARWPLPAMPSGPPCDLRCARARLVLHDVARGLVAYVLDGRVRLLRLADGASAAVATGTAARFLDDGLVYADGFRLRLIPFARLPLR